MNVLVVEGEGEGEKGVLNVPKIQLINTRVLLRAVAEGAIGITRASVAAPVRPFTRGCGCSCSIRGGRRRNLARLRRARCGIGGSCGSVAVALCQPELGLALKGVYKPLL